MESTPKLFRNLDHGFRAAIYLFPAGRLESWHKRLKAHALKLDIVE